MINNTRILFSKLLDIFRTVLSSKIFHKLKLYSKCFDNHTIPLFIFDYKKAC